MRKIRVRLVQLREYAKSVVMELPDRCSEDEQIEMIDRAIEEVDDRDFRDFQEMDENSRFENTSYDHVTELADDVPDVPVDFKAQFNEEGELELKKVSQSGEIQLAGLAQGTRSEE